MDMKHERRAVGVFANRLEAESALLEIKSSGFPMDNVSVVGRNADAAEKVAGVEVHKNIDNKADEGAVAGAVTGGAVGGITGLFVGYVGYPWCRADIIGWCYSYRFSYYPGWNCHRCGWS
jgi:hypothetical protein